MAPNENLSAAPAASTQKKGRGKKIALIVIAIVLAVGLLPTLMTSIINARTVPDVVGMTTTEAAGVISNEGFKVSYIDREGKSLNSYETEGGKVVAQQPEAQAGAKKNDTIVLTVMRLITVPDVIGNTVSEAENKLAHLQIDLANADAIGDKNAWQITEQSLLPNSQVFEDEPIVLSATDKSIVPNAIGMKADEAKILLSHNGLKYEITSDTGKLVVLDDNWVVISQSTEPNTELAVGTVVFLTVSKNSSSTQGITAADIQVSAIDLAQIYMNAGNQVQYEGKLIEVTGEVYSVEVVDSASTDGFVEGLLSDIGNAVFGDTYAVRLVGGTVGYRQVFVDCYDMPSNQLSSLSPGSTVTIIGRCSGNSEHVNITDSIIKP
jgi:beta-lactam-binding protein with PASTA domain